MRRGGRGADQDDPRTFLTELTMEYHTSERENELIDLILQGLSRNEIGERLFISPNTVKTHTTNIYRKIGISSRRELFALFYGRRS
jgi:DNA-binding CsgD family transcriptional regulator